MQIIWFLLVGVIWAVPVPKRAWNAQLGTVHKPASLDLKPIVNVGDIYSIDGVFYQARCNGKSHELVAEHGLPGIDEESNNAWKILTPGTFMFPKKFDSDVWLDEGHIYLHSDEVYYVAAESGLATEIHSTSTLLNEKANWMGLLQDEIGDKRIGDILLPGTHDTGTFGINDDSYLVDRNPLFNFAHAFDPTILTNWSKTQDASWGDQCLAGFRSFDMRIADLEEEDGSFRWWHGTTGLEIEIELQEVVDFLKEHPKEVLRMEFGHFAKPGNKNSPTLPIPNHRKDMIADILLEYLEPYLALQSEHSANPTVNEILYSGKNIILEMHDSYIRPKHDGFWMPVSVSRWVGRTNPEDLFIERSAKQKTYGQSNKDDITLISGAITPDTTMIVAGLLRVYGNNKIFMRLLKALRPDLAILDPDRMSFEGMWTDIINFSRYGLNEGGISVRPQDTYTSGGSIHFQGGNNMAHYWAARPGIFKVNEIHVDDAVGSSTLVETAIRSAKSEIKREVSVTFQGNAKTGYYTWHASKLYTIGGTDGLECTEPIRVRYRIQSSGFSIDENWKDLPFSTEVSFTEGQYPQDATLTLEVTGRELDGEWLQIYSNNIQGMIEGNLDLYLRGTNYEYKNGGFAYTSYTYDLFGESCESQPEEGFIKVLQW